MRQKYIHLYVLFRELSQQILAQVSQARSGIKDRDFAAAAADLHT
jgi:phosphate uptake regulator